MKRLSLTVWILAAFFIAPCLAGSFEDNLLLSQLLPPAQKFEFVQGPGELSYYKGFTAKDVFVGVVFMAKGQGYKDAIEAAASMTPQGQILAIKILKQDETPGVGSGVASKKFLDRFILKRPREFDKIQAITGATVSSNAVIGMVRRKAELILRDLKKK